MLRQADGLILVNSSKKARLEHVTKTDGQGRVEVEKMLAKATLRTDAKKCKRRQKTWFTDGTVGERGKEEGKINEIRRRREGRW